jgi:hypothetical protein
VHPILSQIRRLGLYLLAWAPLTVLVAFLLKASAGFQWRDALTVSAILCLLYALICLSSWYSARAMPLRSSTATAILLTHATGAIVASAIWVFQSRGLGKLMTALNPSAGLEAKIWNAGGLLFGLGIMFYLMSLGLFYVLLAIESSRQAEERALQAQVLARDAELRALKAQVNPHFLYNSLHSISALTSVDAARAREMCIKLGDFLRRTLGLGEKEMIPLSEEIALIRAFLSVEKVRFGARLDIQENIAEEALNYRVPPLLLQPLVENAVAHGIGNLVEGGWVRIIVQPQDGGVAVAVENRFDPETPSARRNGVGLENVRRRVAATYANRARMEVSKKSDCFRVSLFFPAAEKEASVA